MHSCVLTHKTFFWFHHSTPSQVNKARQLDKAAGVSHKALTTGQKQDCDRVACSVRHAQYQAARVGTDQSHRFRHVHFKHASKTGDHASTGTHRRCRIHHRDPAGTSTASSCVCVCVSKLCANIIRMACMARCSMVGILMACMAGYSLAG